jgi:tetratricopeptide (TPR) repeat protein
VDEEDPGPQALWGERLERVLATRPPDDAAALEIAAVLGPEVPLGALQQAFRERGVAPTADWADALAEAGLVAVSREGEVSLAHGALRDGVLEVAARAGRLAGHHEACAELARRAGDPGGLGRHLLRAGRPVEAIDPLLEAVERASRRYDYALGLARDLERAMTEAALPPADPRWGRLWIQQTAERVQARDDEAARALITRTRSAAEQHGWLAELGWASYWDASLRIYLGDMAGTAELAGQAFDRFLAAGEPVGQCRAAMLRSAALRYAGDLRASEPLARAGLALAERLGDPLLLARAHQAASEILLVTGRAGEAEEHSRAALAFAGQLDSVVELARVICGLGDVLRASGRAAEARQSYSESARLYSRSGVAWFRAYPMLNQGLMALLDGQPGEAEPLLREILAGGRPQFLGTAHLGLAVTSAHHRDWSGAARHLGEAERLLATVFDEDNVKLAELGVAVAEAAGQAALAERLEALAIRQRGR